MSTCRRCSGRYPDDHQFCPFDGEPLRPDPKVGDELLGEYRLTRVIGQGAAGTVYEAWHAPTARRVAVKMLDPALIADSTMVRRFDREARVAARLVHPHIATLYTAGVTDDGVPFLVMELAPGQPLDQLLEGGPMAAPRAVAIVRQLVSAVAATHAAGIVHRDLKPANVVVEVAAAGGAVDRVKLVDFGVAKVVAGELGEESALSRAGTVWGTPHYLAPEQARGEAVDGRADLYAIGVMLYEMVTGRVPFPGSGVAVLVAHVSRPPPPPESLVPDLDPGLAALIGRCLAKDPSDRFPSAEALASALDQVAAGGRPAAVPPAAAVASPPAAAVASPPEAPALAPPPPIAAAARSRPGSGSVSALSAPALAAAGRRRWGGRLALAAMAVGLGVAVSQGVDREPAAPPAPAPPAAPPVAAPVGPPAVEEPAVGPGLRVVVIAEGGYALRVLLPERMVVGIEYEIAIDAWDRDGEPIVAPELIATIDDPAGLSRGVAARPSRDAGRYGFRRDFAQAGPHVLRVYPPAGGARIQVSFDVLGPAEALAP